MQVKQAITDYEAKYENKITSIQVVSTLKNISFLIPAFKKNLPTTGFVILIHYKVLVFLLTIVKKFLMTINLQLHQYLD